MNERLTQEQLEAIRKRTEAASTGPWIIEVGEYSGSNWLVAYTGVDVDGTEYFITTDSVRGSDLEGDPKTDAKFIAHAREDVPALLAEIERLNELNNEIIEMIFGDAIRKSAETLVEEIRKKVGR